MKIHEYQAKQILANSASPFRAARLITKPEEARGVAERLGGGPWWSKPRFTPADAAKVAASNWPTTLPKPKPWRGRILGMTLITHQTGPEGRLVKRVLIEEGLDIARELYLGIVIDRASGSLCSWPPAKAAWKSKWWRPSIRKKS